MNDILNADTFIGQDMCVFWVCFFLPEIRAASFSFLCPWTGFFCCI